MERFHPASLVELHWTHADDHNRKTSTESEKDIGQASSSGLILHHPYGCLITHASVLAPYLVEFPLHKDAIRSSKCASHIQTLPIEVTVSAQLCQNNSAVKLGDGLFNSLSNEHASKNKQNEHRKNCTPLLNCTQAGTNEKSDEKSMDIFNGKLISMFKVDSFAKAMEKLMPQDEGWTTHNTIEDEADTQQNNQDKENMSFLLPYFVLIKLQMPKNRIIPYEIYPSKSLSVGCSVAIVGTPFASLCPEIFMNSYSQGVVSNTAGVNNSLLLTDARCIPGSEGGAVCLPQRNSISIAGLVVAPLCWKQNEWIGLSIACSLSEIMDALHNVLGGVKLTKVKTGTQFKPKDSLTASARRVVLVRCGVTWGSGIVIGQNLVLTCSHILKGKREVTVSVRVDYPKRQWLPADVRYATPAQQVLDIAVLRLKEPVVDPTVTPVVVENHPTAGQEVTVVGHALFNTSKQMAPSWSTGTISKVVTYNDVPVMLQTTCLVNSGASGGPVLSTEGKLVGMVTCNARDQVNHASFPHVNLAVPMTTIWPVLQHFINTGDEEVLAQLHIQNEAVKKLWQQGDLQIREDIKSRL